ncbi:hypothetical protein LTSEURB_6369 [Salmonella enterica subsp. enterica serovar Urbana str. R8-2977]|uniref:Uncharacterized protein n=1 Tax=Salmonella enterica subsp. enterica serovar Urbana str. R8-2977 TaxID=913084 RepID=G5S4I4_SALET|nr:hypothetical protein LTSEURB_6369 [Salmonella enterica subsp. enterica serovar Urbana str. R8-2977]
MDGQNLPASFVQTDLACLSGSICFVIGSAKARICFVIGSAKAKARYRAELVAFIRDGT